MHLPEERDLSSDLLFRKIFRKKEDEFWNGFFRKNQTYLPACSSGRSSGRGRRVLELSLPEESKISSSEDSSGRLRDYAGNSSIWGCKVSQNHFFPESAGRIFLLPDDSSGRRTMKYGTASSGRTKLIFRVALPEDLPEEGRWISELSLPEESNFSSDMLFRKIFRKKEDQFWDGLFRKNQTYLPTCSSGRSSGRRKRACGFAQAWT